MSHHFSWSGSRSSSWASSAAVSALFGSAAGAVGTLLVVAFVMPSVSIQPESSPAPRPPIGTAESISATGVEAAGRALAMVVPARTGALSPTNAYAPGDAVGLGMALTSDGWIVVDQVAFESAGRRPSIVVSGKVAAVERIVADPYTGVAFVKVAASDLSVTSFGAAADLEAGDVVYVMDAAGGIQRSTVAGIGTRPTTGGAGETVRSSEHAQRLLRLSGDGVFKGGAMVLDAGGDVVALIDAAGPFGALAVPIEDVASAVGDALKDGLVSRPVLGVGYIDLAQVATGTTVRRGAHVTFVVPGSPAAKAGIRAGDVITSVNDEPVSAKNGLSDLIADYLPGDELALVVQRGPSATEIGVAVELGASK